MKIRIYPPIMAALYLLVALGLNYFFLSAKLVRPPFNFLGIVIIAGGIFLIVWASRTFKKKGTTHNPHGMPTVMVVGGPFRFSRNPMYLGLSSVLLGIAVFGGTVYLFLAPFTIFLTLSAYFIPREEKRLERTFGQEYLDYKKRVRRWL